jgi:polysaccharide chain length determinant protein (PEP-CTERM system associated)
MSEATRQIQAMIGAVRRRRWLIVKIAGALSIAVWLLLLALPSRFEASARVFVDIRTALQPVLKGIAVDEQVDSEVSLVREALLSYPKLAAVARKNGLVGPGRNVDDVVRELQNKVDVTAERSRSEGGGDGKSSVVYVITYRDRSAERSVAIVSSLLDVFVKDTQAGNRSGSGQAQEFLAGQISDYEKRLSAAEARLAEFKRRNVGMIPGDKGDYFSRLDKEMSDQQVAETNLAIAQSRKEALQHQLASTKPYLPGASGGNSGSGNGNTADVSTRLQENEARLADLLSRYTEKHPEVIALRATIADQKVAQARELAELERGGTGTGAIRSLSANPVYQSIQVQLNQVDVELASYRGAIAQHASEIQTLRKFVNSAPEVEQEYSRLNRDYGVTKQQYEALVQRLEQARVSENAAAAGSVRFEVIDPPRAERHPVWPNRRLLALAGLFAGLAAGIGLVLGHFLLAPSVNSVEALAALGVPVLGALTFQRDQQTLSALHRDERMALWSVAGLVGAGLFMALTSDVLAGWLHAILSWRSAS